MKLLLFSLLFFLSVPFSAQMLTSVYFDHNSFELSSGSRKKLDSLSQLKSNLTFRIFGNANPLGSKELNKKLSENRAKKVSDYLAQKIGKNIQLGSSVGLGEGKQINDNSTEEKLAQNRRVDIFIEKSFAPGEKITRKQYKSLLHTKISEMKIRDTFSLPNLNFIGGRSVWLRDAYPTLVDLVNFMKKNKTAEIELQGHICCDYDNFDGEDIDLGTFNLSWTRANAIKDFLVRNGVDSIRIKAIGLGHLNPVVYPEKTNEDRTINRRVEVVLLNK